MMQSCRDEGRLGGNFAFGSSSGRVLVSVLLLVETATLFLHRHEGAFTVIVFQRLAPANNR